MDTPALPEIRVQGNAMMVALRVKPSLSTTVLHLASDDNTWNFKLPRAVFPFAKTDQVLFITLGGVVAFMEDQGPVSSLILPDNGLVIQ